jgi:hypothetical protein
MTVTLAALMVILSLVMPVLAKAQSSSPSADLTPGPVCPLGRVAVVRGSDSEAREGGGFYAARKNGIHGAVDLNGSLGHLHTVEVQANSSITAGHLIGTIGYSGNAASLQTKNLPPHLHFGYLRAVPGIDGKAAPLARVKNSGDGFRAYAAKDAIMADAAGILNPLQAVKLLKCWEDSPPAARSTLSVPR